MSFADIPRQELTTMHKSFKHLSFLSITALAVGASMAFSPADPAASKHASVPYSTVSDIMTKKCATCHQGATPPAKFDATTYKGVMKGNDHGSVIVAGKPDKSLLYTLITATTGKKMPPRKPLEKEEIAKIEAWIKAGATEK